MHGNHEPTDSTASNPRVRRCRRECVRSRALLAAVDDEPVREVVRRHGNAYSISR